MTTTIDVDQAQLVRRLELEAARPVREYSTPSMLSEPERLVRDLVRLIASAVPSR